MDSPPTTSASEILSNSYKKMSKGHRQAIHKRRNTNGQQICGKIAASLVIKEYRFKSDTDPLIKSTKTTKTLLLLVKKKKKKPLQLSAPSFPLLENAPLMPRCQDPRLPLLQSYGRKCGCHVLSSCYLQLQQMARTRALT